MNSNDSIVELFTDQLNEFNIDQMYQDAHGKLSQWFNECQQRIKDFYDEKLEELRTYIDEIKIQYDEKKRAIQTHLNQLENRDEDESRLIFQAIQRNLDDLKQICIQINPRPIIIDESEICIGKKFHLPNLSSNCSTISYSNLSSSAITSNNQYLLMHKHPFLYLIDRNTNQIKEYLWAYDWIRDMCWSSTLRKFFILTSNQIFFADEQILNVYAIENICKQTWFSCTCSEKSLYLSTFQWGSSIYEFNLQSSVNFVQQWKSPITCKSSEGVYDIQYNNTKLALVIKDSEDHKRCLVIKLSDTFQTLWILSLDISMNVRLLTCCPLKSNEWLVIDGANLSLYHVTGQGKITEKIDCSSVPYRANLFGSNTFVLSTELTLHLYPISL
ncbi:hypothetical protein I4U23_021493 [Adineta vaga]|nr:hypothetical protein I4U23_021493 [Adineta vaga]